MLRVKTLELIPGQMVAEDVETSTNIKLLIKGSILSKYSIDFLVRWNIEEIYIEEEVEAIVYSRATEIDRLTTIYNKTLRTTVGFMEGLRVSNILKLDEVRQVVYEISKFIDIIPSLKVINQLKSADDYTHQHSINVGIYSTFIGRWLGLGESELRKLTFSALLHDVGKMKIPQEILNKPGLLTPLEYEIMKRHSIEGYNLLKDNANLSSKISMGVLQHHERENGKGYPFGLTGDKIHLFGKIIAVADIYDAMTSNRVYKKKTSPFETAEKLMESSFGELDLKITKLFVERLSDFFVSSFVLLDNGKIAQIIAKNRDFPTRPLIRIEDGFVDLSTTKHLNISEVI